MSGAPCKWRRRECNPRGEWGMGNGEWGMGKNLLFPPPLPTPHSPLPNIHMLADIVKIHCLKHHAAFPMPRTSRVVVCREGGEEHTLSENFPYSGSWIYCCNCQTFIAWD